MPVRFSFELLRDQCIYKCGSSARLQRISVQQNYTNRSAGFTFLSQCMHLLHPLWFRLLYCLIWLCFFLSIHLTDVLWNYIDFPQQTEPDNWKELHRYHVSCHDNNHNRITMIRWLSDVLSWPACNLVTEFKNMITSTTWKPVSQG